MLVLARRRVSSLAVCLRVSFMGLVSKNSFHLPVYGFLRILLLEFLESFIFVFILHLTIVTIYCFYRLTN